MKIKHPAKYSTTMIEIFAKLLPSSTKTICDPMAGTGKIVQILDYGITAQIYCNDLESEWSEETEWQARTRAIWAFEDAAHLSYENHIFDAIITSPTYGNRLADHHNPKDGSKRFSYKFNLGHDLNEQNTGAMQWGSSYQNKHCEIWKECHRILKPGGIFLLNISDHIRQKKIVPVTKWHLAQCEDIGFVFHEQITIPTSRLRQGANSKARVDHESICVFYKPLEEAH